jgi:hypothetical protein
MNVEIGTVAVHFQFSGNVCYKSMVLLLCSVASVEVNGDSKKAQGWFVVF